MPAVCGNYSSDEPRLTCWRRCNRCGTLNAVLQIHAIVVLLEKLSFRILRES